MANHTITIVNRMGGGGAGGGDGTARQSNVSKTNSATSIKKKLEDKNSKKSGILKAIKIGRNLNVGSAVGLMGGGAGMAVAVAQEMGSTLRQGTDLYANYMTSRTGETMRYHNLKQRVNVLTKPVSFAKQAIWDYGVVAPMEIARQNENLNYQRQLTGNMVFSKTFQNSTF